MNISMDNQTVISAITDISDSITLSSDEIQQKLDEMRILVETKLTLTTPEPK